MQNIKCFESQLYNFNIKTLKIKSKYLIFG